MNGMKHIKRWIAIPVIFLSGVIIGVYGGISHTRKQVRDLAGRAPQMFVGSMMKDISLSPEQQTNVDAIVVDMREKNEFLNSLYFPQFRKVIDDAMKDIKNQLTPEQREQLETNTKEMEQRWQRRSRHGRRPDSPDDTNRPPRRRPEPGQEPGPPPKPEPGSGPEPESAE